MELISKLREIEKSYKEIEQKMADPEVANNPKEMQSLGKKHVDLSQIVEAFMGINRATDLALGCKNCKG